MASIMTGIHLQLPPDPSNDVIAPCPLFAATNEPPHRDAAPSVAPYRPPP
jgi:hypothetical protein